MMHSQGLEHRIFDCNVPRRAATPIRRRYQSAVADPETDPALIEITLHHSFVIRTSVVGFGKMQMRKSDADTVLASSMQSEQIRRIVTPNHLRQLWKGLLQAHAVEVECLSCDGAG
jgi:hypothetical protein